MLAPYTRSLHLWAARDLATYRRHGHIPLHPHTMRWPAFGNGYARLEAALQYHFTKSLTGKLFYVFELFTKHDWQTDILTPFLGPGFPELLMPHWGISVPRRSRPPVPARP